MLLLAAIRKHWKSFLRNQERMQQPFSKGKGKVKEGDAYIHPKPPMQQLLPYKVERAL
jgi:hypothetical protein